MGELVRVQIQGSALTREGLALIIRGFEGLEVVAESGTILLLAGEEWADFLEGGDAAASRPVPVLLCGGKQHEILRAGRLGVQVFLDTSDPPPVLEQALRAAARGEAFCSPALVPLMVDALRRPARAGKRRPGGLSEREYEVALLAAEGRTDREIAEHLFISVTTVKYHLRNSRSKLGITRRTQFRDGLARSQSMGMGAV